MTPTKTSGNRRRSTRYEFHTEGKYTVYARGQAVQSGSARTLNLSSGGLWLSVDRPVPVNHQFEANLAWPGLYHDAERARLIVTGQVVRVEGVYAAVRILTRRFHTTGRRTAREVSAA